jgi:hypothetical protein
LWIGGNRVLPLLEDFVNERDRRGTLGDGAIDEIRYPEIIGLAHHISGDAEENGARDYDKRSRGPTPLEALAESPEGEADEKAKRACEEEAQKRSLVGVRGAPQRDYVPSD